MSNCKAIKTGHEYACIKCNMTWHERDKHLVSCNKSLDTDQSLNSALCEAIDLVKIETVLVRMVREKKIAFKDAARYRTLLQSTLELLRGKL